MLIVRPGILFPFFACGILDDIVDDLEICSDLKNLAISGFGPLQSQTVVAKRSSVPSNKELLQNWDMESVMYMNANIPL